MVCARFLGWENNASSGYLEFRLEKTGDLNIIVPALSRSQLLFRPRTSRVRRGTSRREEEDERAQETD